MWKWLICLACLIHIYNNNKYYGDLYSAQQVQEGAPVLYNEKYNNIK